MQYSYEDVFNAVKQIIVQLYPYVDINKITDTALFRYDLGLDAYDMVDLIFEIEHHYNKLFDMDNLEQSKNVQTFCRLLCKELNKTQIVTAQQKQTNLLTRIKQFFIKQRQ